MKFEGSGEFRCPSLFVKALKMGLRRKGERRVGGKTWKHEN
jgi:hypothetical protein